jgi:predicted enzyme related to lactoylglutathione lyase
MSNFTIKRLNHLVLWVRDAQRAMEFYRDVLGFTIVEMPSPQAVFMRANGSDNHHDLGLFGIGMDAPPPSTGRQVGLYHAAWEVASIQDLATAREGLTRAAPWPANPTTATASVCTPATRTATNSRCSGCCRARSGSDAALARAASSSTRSWRSGRAERTKVRPLMVSLSKHERIESGAATSAPRGAPSRSCRRASSRSGRARG